MRSQPLIAVTDVEASSPWYQRLPGLQSDHGGQEYERLLANGELVLQLHGFEGDHHHGPIGDPANKPYGNGVLPCSEIDDFKSAVARATTMNMEVVLPRHRTPTSENGGPNQCEFWLRDLDGDTVVLSQPIQFRIVGRCR